jgi:hypothetical protein
MGKARAKIRAARRDAHARDAARARARVATPRRRRRPRAVTPIARASSDARRATRRVALTTTAIALAAFGDARDARARPLAVVEARDAVARDGGRFHVRDRASEGVSLHGGRELEVRDDGGGERDEGHAGGRRRSEEDGGRARGGGGERGARGLRGVFLSNG